jgi:hypothetical protein
MNCKEDIIRFCRDVLVSCPENEVSLPLVSPLDFDMFYFYSFFFLVMPLLV